MFNRAGRVFVGQRMTGAEHVAPGHEWQMPQGGIDKGEKPKQAALRELHEETNIRSVRLLGKSSDWLQYDLPQDIIKKSWKGKYRGQSQRWYAFRFEGDDSEIDVLAPGGGGKPEFSAWRWVPIQDAVSLVIPFKKEVYTRIAHEFGPFATPQ